MSLRGLLTLVLSLSALGFVAWMIAVHPDQQRLYGPAPGSEVRIAATHAAPAANPGAVRG